MSFWFLVLIFWFAEKIAVASLCCWLEHHSLFSAFIRLISASFFVRFRGVRDSASISRFSAIRLSWDQIVLVYVHSRIPKEWQLAFLCTIETSIRSLALKMQWEPPVDQGYPGCRSKCLLFIGDS
ncbi:uncharacterized protein [Nicotiana sylvestris]|uniref:uncharacterized protein n=1 Tax=Nicotiana sylvestris TaxID=4096 RepID=UPI00388CBEC8